MKFVHLSGIPLSQSVKQNICSYVPCYNFSLLNVYLYVVLSWKGISAETINEAFYDKWNAAGVSNIFCCSRHFSLVSIEESINMLTFETEHIHSVVM